MIAPDGGGPRVAAIAQATKASGVIVRVRAKDFLGIVDRQEVPLIVHAVTGIFTKKHQYLTSYKGLAFVTKSETRLDLPVDSEVVDAAKIWLPD
jgi:hypothetical protein